MQKIKTYRSPKTIIRLSSKGGKGLFAQENIMQGEIIAIKNGHFVNSVEASILDKEIGDFSLQISDEFFICPRTKEEIEDEVKNRIKIMAQNGGFIIAPTHHVQIDTSLENFYFFWNSVDKYGKYPINI